MNRNRNENAGVIWIILILGLVAGIVSLLTWPFRAIARRLPGRREKELQEVIDQRRADMRAARQLLGALAAGDSRSAAKLERSLEKAEAENAKVLSENGWPEDFESEYPGAPVLGILDKLGITHGMDWRSSPEDLQQTLAPLLKRRGIKLDWSFVNDLDAIDNGKALRNPVFLPVVGDHVEQHGHVLALVIEGSDAYTFAVCTPEEFAQIDGLTCRSFTIHRASSATGPVPEP